MIRLNSSLLNLVNQMSFSEIEIKNISRSINAFMKKRRPPVEDRDQVDLLYKIVNNSIEIFEIRPQWDNPNATNEIPIAKTTFVKSKDCWKIFWMRSDLKWHAYFPDSEVETLDQFLAIVEEDEDCCFWG